MPINIAALLLTPAPRRQCKHRDNRVDEKHERMFDKVLGSSAPGAGHIGLCVRIHQQVEAACTSAGNQFATLTLCCRNEPLYI